MKVDLDFVDDLVDRADAYFDDTSRRKRSFDARLLQEPLTLLPNRRLPLVFHADATVKDAMQAMQRGHRGCVVITTDGTVSSALIGIFTERDVLLKVIDCGRNPATIPLRDVMTLEPESLAFDAKLARALNMMSVGGFRHIPVTDAQGQPAFIISVRDIVEFLVESFPAEILNLPPDIGRLPTNNREGA